MALLRVSVTLTDNEGDERLRVWYERTNKKSSTLCDDICRTLDNCMVLYDRVEVDVPNLV